MKPSSIAKRAQRQLHILVWTIFVRNSFEMLFFTNNCIQRKVNLRITRMEQKICGMFHKKKICLDNNVVDNILGQ